MMRHRLGIALNEDHLIDMKYDNFIRDASLRQPQVDGSAWYEPLVSPLLVSNIP